MIAPADHRPLTRRLDIALGLALAVGIFWLLGYVLILMFAALLLGIVLDVMTKLLQRALPLPRGAAFAVAAAGTFGAIFVALLLLIPPILRQAGALWTQLSDVWSSVRAYLLEFDWIARLLEDGETDISLSDAAAVASSQITGVLSQLVSAGSSALIISILALFLAAGPHTYRRGVVRLLPRHWMKDGLRVMTVVAAGLRRWLLGQTVSMLFLGITVSAGLYLLGIEIWLSLGLLVAIFTMVPYLGPLVAGLPVLAVAFGSGWETGAAVTVFYLVVQNLEGYLVTPLVQRRAVEIPPALLICSQVVMGAVAGVPGILVAAPLAVAAMIAVDELYVKTALGKP